MVFTQRTLRLGQRPSGQCFPSELHFNFLCVDVKRARKQTQKAAG